MLLKGLQKLTLLDYPEKIAATVFSGGCNFKCPFCDHEIDYNTQCVYKLIQKKLGRRVLIDEEIKEHKPWANAAQDKRDTITQVCSIVGFGILVLVIALLAQKFGK